MFFCDKLLKIMILCDKYLIFNSYIWHSNNLNLSNYVKISYNFSVATLSFTQVGINTENPLSDLEIVSKGNSPATKNLELNSQEGTEIFSLYDNGNSTGR